MEWGKQDETEGSYFTKKSLNRQYQKSTNVVIEKMREAAENGADILLLPEAFLTGYELPMSNEEALPDDNPYLRQICGAAGRLHIGAVVTAITKGLNKPQNSAYVVDKNGGILMKYSKVHTCDFADEPTEGLYYAEFDMDAIRGYREQEMMGNTFRKVKAYGALLSEKIEYPFIREHQNMTDESAPKSGL